MVPCWSIWPAFLRQPARPSRIGGCGRWAISKLCDSDDHHQRRRPVGVERWRFHGWVPRKAYARELSQKPANLCPLLKKYVLYRKTKSHYLLVEICNVSTGRGSAFYGRNSTCSEQANRPTWPGACLDYVRVVGLPIYWACAHYESYNLLWPVYLVNKCSWLVGILELTGIPQGLTG
jgi:hypothetical protein